MDSTAVKTATAGAALLGSLAYPGSRPKADSAAALLLLAVIRNRVSSGDLVPSSLMLLSKLQNQAECAKALEDVCSIISKQRLIAAKMAWPEADAFLRSAIGSEKPRVVHTHSSIEMISAVSFDLDERTGRKTDANSGNILHRSWKPTLPVLHIALALHYSINESNGVNVGDVLLNEGFLHLVLWWSRVFAPMVVGVFGVDAASQIAVPDA